MEPEEGAFWRYIFILFSLTFMLVSSKTSRWIQLNCVIVYQLPAAELREGQGAVWAAQLLEWGQLYLQESG